MLQNKAKIYIHNQILNQEPLAYLKKIIFIILKQHRYNILWKCGLKVGYCRKHLPHFESADPIDNTCKIALPQIGWLRDKWLTEF